MRIRIKNICGEGLTRPSAAQRVQIHAMFFQLSPVRYAKAAAPAKSYCFGLLTLPCSSQGSTQRGAKVQGIGVFEARVRSQGIGFFGVTGQGIGFSEG
jgi:hypothetical protein